MAASPSLRALVTGANGAIGKAIAAGLVQHGFDTILVCRSQERGKKLLQELIQANPGAKLTLELCDLSSPRQIHRLGERFQGTLHILINNAAHCPRSREETGDGLERQFATNVLGYAAMIEAFSKYLSKGSRVINVASYWAGGLDLTDLQFKRRRYDNDNAYRQSKQADRMLSAAYAKALNERDIRVYSCHPGDVPSKLSSDLGFGGHESPAKGAQTPLFLSLESLDRLPRSGYFEHCRQKQDPFLQDTQDVESLYRTCQRYLNEIYGKN